MNWQGELLQSLGSELLEESSTSGCPSTSQAGQKIKEWDGEAKAAVHLVPRRKGTWF